jgi:hypothetical protein
LVSITATISLAWLIYLTFNDIKIKGCCPKSKEETTDLSKIKDDYNEGERNKESAKEEEKEDKKEKGPKGNNKEEGEDYSAHEFLHRISGKSD